MPPPFGLPAKESTCPVASPPVTGGTSNMAASGFPIPERGAISESSESRGASPARPSESFESWVRTETWGANPEKSDLRSACGRCGITRSCLFSALRERAGALAAEGVSAIPKLSGIFCGNSIVTGGFDCKERIPYANRKTGRDIAHPGEFRISQFTSGDLMAVSFDRPSCLC